MIPENICKLIYNVFGSEWWIQFVNKSKLKCSLTYNLLRRFGKSEVMGWQMEEFREGMVTLGQSVAHWQMDYPIWF